MNNLLNKTLPHNIDAEEAILAAIFIRASLLDDISELAPTDFYKGAHKKIFTAIKTLEKKKEPVDLVSVAQELINKEELESIGGIAYLSCISDCAPIALNIKNYSKIIMELSKVRELIQIASEIIEQGLNNPDVDDYISSSQAKILQIQTTNSQDKIFPIEGLLHDALDRIEDARKREIEIGFKSQYSSIPLFHYDDKNRLLLKNL